MSSPRHGREHHHGDDDRFPSPRSPLVATYESVDAARSAVEALEAAGVGRNVVELDERHDDTATAAVEEQERSRNLAPGPALMTTKPMLQGGWRGIVRGVAAFGGLGLVVAVLLVALEAVTPPIGALIVLGMVIAGTVAGAIIGAGTRAQRKQWQDMTPEHRVGVNTDDPEILDRATGVLRRTEPARLDHFTEHGSET